MSKYRATVAERVECAKHIQAKVTGVNQLQQRHSLPSVDDWIAAGGEVQKLRSPGDVFLDTSTVAIGVRE